MLALVLGGLAGQDRMPTLGAGLVYRPVPDSIVTLGIGGAGIKEFAPAGRLLDKNAFTPLDRARDFG